MADDLPPVLALRPVSSQVPGIVPKIPGAGYTLQTAPDGESASWLVSVGGVAPAFTYPNQAARRTAPELVAANLYKTALQADTGVLWCMTPNPAGGATPVWQQIGQGPENTFVNLSSFFTAGSVLQSVQSDVGVTTGATFTWADQSGNGKDYTQATSGKQPTLTTGLNGNPGLSFTFASATLLHSALNLPAPGTTPTWIGMVWRNITPIGTGRMICDTSTGVSQVAYDQTTNNHLSQYNGSVGNTDLGVAANTWTCDEFYFSNSASDYIKRGSAAVVTGANAGNGTGTGRNLGGCDALTLYSNAELLHVIYVNSKQPTAIANWRAAVAAKYGGSVSA